MGELPVVGLGIAEPREIAVVLLLFAAVLLQDAPFRGIQKVTLSPGWY
jgi:hypothetical protein